MIKYNKIQFNTLKIEDRTEINNCGRMHCSACIQELHKHLKIQKKCAL